MEFIFLLQEVLVEISILLLVFLPISSVFFDFGFAFKGFLYTISLTAVFLVMIVRPLSDLFGGQLWLKRLIILRKGFGILSASIIVAFLISNIIAPGSAYLSSFFTPGFWSFSRYTFFAHIGDVSGGILLITSNQFAQKLLKRNWKRIQRLSYVYFYAGAIYEAFALQSSFALYAMLIVTVLTVAAWAGKRAHRKALEGENQ